jgi:vitamin K-dependent gamma-carboxylase
MKNRLFDSIDNSPLIIFRLFFGFLLACESFGSIATGWVHKNLIEPKFTFSHIYMDWLQPLPGAGMYIYYILMGICGLLVMAGFRYRWSLAGFTLLWAGVYYMQKTSYNNHYYLLLLVCIIMLFLPANRYASIDVLQNPRIKKYTMPAWCSWVMILQITIVYLYATLAKFYPGWLDGAFTKSLLQQTIHSSLYTVAGQKWFYLFIAYAGIAFDLFIVPFLLYRKTRTIALIASVIFHIFNSLTLHIGIFPFFALSFVVFFYPPETMRRIFFKKRPVVTEHEPSYENKSALMWFFIPYFIIQLILPVRHYFIKGDVLWTEEGHRLSWRMMLRFRDGIVNFKVVDKKTNNVLPYDPLKDLTRKQRNTMAAKPDMIWQTCQRIKQQFKARGYDVAVYADAKASINGSPMKQLTNPDTDLAATPWNYFGHDEWVLMYDDDGNLIR